MDQNSSQFETKKKTVLNKITGILIDEMTQKKIDQVQGQEIAIYILDQIKNVKDEFSLTAFLKQLSEKYSSFKQYYVNISSENQAKKTDEEKISSIVTQLSELANFKTK